MTSEERRAARRARREAERARRCEERQRALTIERVADFASLHRAATQCQRGVSWKAAVQRYMADEFLNVARARRQLLAGEDVRRGFHEFDVRERGKVRHIASVNYSERVIQKSLAQNVLVPALTPSFVRNNTANTRGRGLHDAMRRLKRDLARHYREHGTDGYILLVDFSDYFGSIDHALAGGMVSAAVDDPGAAALARSFIDAHGEVGLGLGSEPSQLVAVAFPGRIDHYVTEVLRLPYGRYMDDSYAMAPDKLTLQIALAQIRDQAARMGLEVNERKTHIVKLSHGFTWLKKRWSFGEHGRIVVRPSRDSVTRERRRLKAHARMVAAGVLTREEAQQSYQSWRGSMGRLDAHGAVLRMDALWRELFGRDPQ